MGAELCGLWGGYCVRKRLGEGLKKGAILCRIMGGWEEHMAFHACVGIFSRNLLFWNGEWMHIGGLPSQSGKHRMG